MPVTLAWSRLGDPQQCPPAGSAGQHPLSTQHESSHAMARFIQTPLTTLKAHQPPEQAEMKHQEGAGTGQLVRHVLMDCLRAADPRWHGQAFGKALHILAWRHMDCARISLVLRPFFLAAPDTLTSHSWRWLTLGSDPVPICSPQYSMGASCRHQT